MEIGIDSFAAILPNPATGELPSAADRMADLLDEVEVADRGIYIVEGSISIAGQTIRRLR